MVFSAEELEEVLEQNSKTSRLTVVEASLTWCRPCMAFERTFEARPFPSAPAMQLPCSAHQHTPTVVRLDLQDGG